MIQTETLELLEWPRLCQHLATFTATKLGAIAARQLPIPQTQQGSLTLLAQTQEVYQLENALPNSLNFDGIQDIGDALERAALQGILMGDELLAIATTLSGARNLRRTVDAQPQLTVLNQLVAELRTYPELEKEIHRCIDERGKVMDRASPKLADIRIKLKQQRDRIYQILQNMLQRHSNAVQESLITQRGDRFVLPVKSSHRDVISGIVHDTSTSGLTLYIEPQSIVGLGNQMRQWLRQEQVEEEAVRRVLTAQVGAVKPDLERLLAIATTLDLATARARYSFWLGANPPRFVTFGSASVKETAPIQPPTSATHPQPDSKPAPIVLRQLRHPLLVWQQQHEQGTPVVPVDLLIQPRIRVVAITGPNTGGKTVTLKTLGLTALMAKVGLFVPAREPVEMPWFDQILADIGDEQSLQQSLSTFSGHIRRISRILDALGAKTENTPDQNTQNQTIDDDDGEATALASDHTDVNADANSDVNADANTDVNADINADINADANLDVNADANSNQPENTPENADTSGDSLQELTVQALEDNAAADSPATVNLRLSPLAAAPLSSLVLLDEVGAGTDPSEGSALAIALLRHLADHATLTVATTHFGELKALKYQDERFENASVEFNDVSMSPTYRLLWGIPGRSNALAIARRLGLKPEILDEAQTHVGASSSEEVNQVIAGLEEQRRQQEEKAKTAEQLVQQAERLHREVSGKATMLQQRERDLQQQQEQAVEQAIAQARGEIARVIRQLQQGPVTAQAAQQATETLNAIGDRRLPSRKQPAKPKPGFRPQVGDRIRIPRLGQTADVLTNPNDDGELTVRFGLMKMTVSLADVESLQGEKAELKTKDQGLGNKGQGSGKPGSGEAAAPVSVPQAPAIRTSKNTFDIRGSRVADAEVELERAIAAAQPGPIWVIHGHGTGKLRQGVQEFLKRHPQVERFEAADQADGGTGVTVAHIQ